jgi:hypothetical protein
MLLHTFITNISCVFKLFNNAVGNDDTDPPHRRLSPSTNKQHWLRVTCWSRALPVLCSSCEFCAIQTCLVSLWLFYLVTAHSTFPGSNEYFGTVIHFSVYTDRTRDRKITVRLQINTKFSQYLNIWSAHWTSWDSSTGSNIIRKEKNSGAIKT